MSEAGAPEKKGGLTGRGLGCLIIVGVFVVGAIGVAMEPKHGPVVASPPPPSRPPSFERADRADEEAAADVVRAMRAYYELGLAVAAADWKWATCHDETVGYDALLACERAVHAEIQVLRAKLPAASAASPCSREVEEVHCAYIDGQARFHADILAWLEANRATLAPAMRRKTLGNGACDVAQKACDARPVDAAEKYGSVYGASYARVSTVECTQRLFQCGAEDNVCHLNKVAERIGLGPDARRGDLAVRSTGQRIQ